MFNSSKLENHLTKYTVDLIRHLVRTEQAKNNVVSFIGEVLHIDKVEALRYYKEYRSYLLE